MHFKNKREFGSAFVLIFCLTPKALSGPILVPFIILSDPRKEKQKMFSLLQFKRRRRWKRQKGQKEGREKAKKAAGGDSPRLIPPSGFRPWRPAGNFLRSNFPVISPVVAISVKSLTQNWVKVGQNSTDFENNFWGHSCPLMSKTNLEGFLYETANSDKFWCGFRACCLLRWIQILRSI